jgi:hypothetical protein
MLRGDLVSVINNQIEHWLCSNEIYWKVDHSVFSVICIEIKENMKVELDAVVIGDWER